MTQAEQIAGILKQKVEMLKMHLADFTDADMLVRPVPGANHAAWQMAHLAQAEIGITHVIAGDTMLKAPDSLAACQGKEAAARDGANDFPKKDELLRVIEDATNVQLTALRNMSDEHLAKPAPENLRHLAGTLAQLLLLTANHASMHAGQIQVIRRKLGKPVLF